jgi:hypothetical protein
VRPLRVNMFACDCISMIKGGFIGSNFARPYNDFAGPCSNFARPCIDFGVPWLAEVRMVADLEGGDAAGREAALHSGRGPRAFDAIRAEPHPRQLPGGILRR